MLIWNPRSGTLIGKYPMPTVEERLAEQEEDTDESDDTATPVASSSSASTTTFPSSEKRRYYNNYNEPKIKSLVIHENRLLVVMDGYEEVAQYNNNKKSSDSSSSSKDRILSGSTHLRTYDTNDLADGVVKVISTNDVKGRFNEIRVIDGVNAHVMTISNINTYKHLVAPFDRYNHPFYTMTDDEYVDAVYQYANDKAIPDFVNKLVDELLLEDGSIPNLARICLWQKDDDDLEPTSKAKGFEQLTFREGIIKTLPQVHSVDIGAPTTTTNSQTLDVNSAGAVSFLLLLFLRLMPCMDACVWSKRSL